MQERRIFYISVGIWTLLIGLGEVSYSAIFLLHDVGVIHLPFEDTGATPTTATAPTCTSTEKPESSQKYAMESRLAWICLFGINMTMGTVLLKGFFQRNSTLLYRWMIWNFVMVIISASVKFYHWSAWLDEREGLQTFLILVTYFSLQAFLFWVVHTHKKQIKATVGNVILL